MVQSPFALVQRKCLIEVCGCSVWVVAFVYMNWRGEFL